MVYKSDPKLSAAGTMLALSIVHALNGEKYPRMLVFRNMIGPSGIVIYDVASFPNYFVLPREGGRRRRLRET